MATYKLFLLPGDGIGPEVMAEVEKVASACARLGLARFETEKGLVGGSAYDAPGAAISEADMARAQAADAVLLAAVGGPKWANVPYEARPEAGLLLLIAAVMLLVRAIGARHRLPIWLSAVGLTGIVAASFAGIAFAGNGAAGSSLGMAIAFAVSLACYVVVILVLAPSTT